MTYNLLERAIHIIEYFGILFVILFGIFLIFSKLEKSSSEASKSGFQTNPEHAISHEIDDEELLVIRPIGHIGISGPSFFDN